MLPANYASRVQILYRRLQCCNACADACDDCATGCLDEPPDVSIMAECIRQSAFGWTLIVPPCVASRLATWRAAVRSPASCAAFAPTSVRRAVPNARGTSSRSLPAVRGRVPTVCRGVPPHGGHATNGHSTRPKCRRSRRNVGTAARRASRPLGRASSLDSFVRDRLNLSWKPAVQPICSA